MQVRGEYEITIQIQNMFHSYEMRTGSTNIVTDSGLNFILRVLCGKTSERFGGIKVGTNSSDASNLDTVDTFSPKQDVVLDARSDVVGNQLIYEVNTLGSNIDGTCEIGIFSESGNVLVTRDVHEEYDVPNSAIITIKYTLSLTDKTHEEVIAEDMTEEPTEVETND